MHMRSDFSDGAIPHLKASTKQQNSKWDSIPRSLPLPRWPMTMHTQLLIMQKHKMRDTSTFCFNSKSTILKQSL